jgi:(p)ppGpp synthase/HD superfamily hydrolase
MTLLERAIEIAVHAHAGQMDEDGLPHIIHSLEVMFAVKRRFSGDRCLAPILKKYTEEELLIAAVLHDTVEDSKGAITLDYIKSVFGENVAEIVDSVTRRGLGEGETKEFYRDFIYRARLNEGGAIIKLSDLHHNFGRLNKIAASKKKWREKLEFKYGISIGVITDNISWEQASWSVQHDGPHAHYYIADPNGKKIEIPEEEFNQIFAKK